MLRIPTLNPDNTPAMPTKLNRAEGWIEEGRAEWVKTDLRIKAVRLLFEPSGRNVQPIAVGIDPGKSYSGIAVQSSRSTLFMAHLILPFKRVRERMDNRRMMRRGRRGRRINRKIPFQLRAHRQKRFDNRRQSKLAPSIKANRQLEIRVTRDLCELFPVSNIVFEYVKADVDLTSGRKKAQSGKSFSAVMVGQKWAIEQLSKLAPVSKMLGWETSNLRKRLNLLKIKDKKSQMPESHAVDGIMLAASIFTEYRQYQGLKTDGADWFGAVNITSAPFTIIHRPPISRRQLHLMVPAKGDKRRKYGGTVTRHGFRKGDLVIAEKKGKTSIGWVSGDTKTQISLSDFSWKRLGYWSPSKTRVLRRNTGLLVECPQRLSVSRALSPAA